MWNDVRRPVTTALLGIAAAIGIAIVPALTQPQTLAPSPPAASANRAAIPALPPPQSDGRHELTKADADAWLDGYFPYALAQGDIAGAVVVVIKDGQVLTQRGYGYADVATRKPVDPANTLFRAGSISKLFTWTAVMQMVEQGKIDLDADVNQYIDFKIPPYQGKPITMRQILTHTAGFQEAVKGGIRDSGTPPPLGDVVKKLLPERIYAPGSTPAYSNFATALAGYIVERVSGLSFDDYIERNIFQRLGMNRSSFRQPLPANLAPFMSKGYQRGSAEPRPFEIISVPPAGSISISGADMAKFMIAHLNQGGPLMKPDTARLMHSPANVSIPGLNRMALGFYETRINDLIAIGHGGDLGLFHSYMWIMPSQNAGLYISVNSGGTGSANLAIRLGLLEQFSDRYFPRANNNPPVELPTAKEHAKMLTGSYVSSRGFFTNFLDVSNFLGQSRITLDKDGRPVVPDLLNRSPRKWIEIAPFVWQDAYGNARLAGKVENGKIVRWSVDTVSPFMVWDRVPWHRDAAWLMPLAQAALGIVVLTALFWPIGAIYRRRYGAAPALSGRDLKVYRLSRIFSWLIVATIGGWMMLMQALSDVSDLWIWVMEIGGTIAFFGLFGFAWWNLWLDWKGKRSLLTKLWGIALALASLVILWIALNFHLISFGTQY